MLFFASELWGYSNFSIPSPEFPWFSYFGN